MYIIVLNSSTTDIRGWAGSGCGGAVLCAVECLAAPLTFTQWLSVAPLHYSTSVMKLVSHFAGCEMAKERTIALDKAYENIRVETCV